MIFIILMSKNDQMDYLVKSLDSKGKDLSNFQTILWKILKEGTLQ